MLNGSHEVPRRALQGFVVYHANILVMTGEEAVERRKVKLLAWIGRDDAIAFKIVHQAARGEVARAKD